MEIPVRNHRCCTHNCTPTVTLVVHMRCIVEGQAMTPPQRRKWRDHKQIELPNHFVEPQGRYDLHPFTGLILVFVYPILCDQFPLRR